MSLYDYEIGRGYASQDPPFYALIQAAMRGADTRNGVLLRNAFPATWDELQARYNAPGGLLAGETSLDELARRRRALADEQPETDSSRSLKED